MKVVVLTTSYPRDVHDFAGRFVADAVDELRGHGVEVDVVAPGVYRDWGLAYGGGVAANARRRPWLAPLLLLSMVRAVRHTAADADLVHAHWLAAALVARFAGRPFVVTLHGTGSAGRFSGRRARAAAATARPLAAPAGEAVICVSETVAAAMRAAGVERVTTIPNGVRIPDTVGEPVSPPEVLYVGRLSPEKNIDTLMKACGDLNLVVAGDGQLRTLVPNGLGAVPNDEVERLLERAAVVVAPCDTEGFGLAAAGGDGATADLSWRQPAVRCSSSWRTVLRACWSNRGTRRRCAPRSRRCSRMPSFGRGSEVLRASGRASASAGSASRS